MNKRLEQLLKKKEQIENRIQLLKSKENEKKRKEETRKKILLGAWVMHQVEQGYLEKEEVLLGLDKFLTRPIDRQLFGLKVEEND
jgi:large subunit ribosomal protein L7/L12